MHVSDDTYSGNGTTGLSVQGFTGSASTTGETAMSSPNTQGWWWAEELMLQGENMLPHSQGAQETLYPPPQ